MSSITRILFIILAFATFPRVQGQINPPQVDLTLTQGIVFRDTVHSNYPPTYVPSIPNTLFITRTPAGIQNKYVFEISLIDSVNYTGLVKVLLQYTSGNFPPQPKWTEYNVHCVSSIIEAKNDYATHDGESPVVLYPLLNDHTTADTLILSGIGQIQEGSAVYEGDSITFTPTGEEDAYIIYSIKDNQNNTTQGKINVLFQNNETVFNDTLYFTLLHTKSQAILFPYEGFTVVGQPQKGQLSSPHERAFEYVPNKNAIGSDVFEFEHSNGSTRRVEITLKSIPQYTSSVRDDNVYTARNQSVSFNVFDNDLSRNFPINQYSAQLTYLGSGNFSYTPPSNFVGIKQFTYRVNYGTYTSTGKITIHVDNCYPKQDIEYRFNTPKNIPVAVQYDVPIGGYTFTGAVNPEYGTLTFYNDQELVEWGCNSLSSKAMFIYTPDQNYYGEDEFQISYCIEDEQCIIYKIYITTHDETQDTLCHCVGKNCVWPGDFDNDGFVTVKDLLPLGRYLGLTGEERQDLIYDYWNGQVALDWGVSQKNGTDIKHVDANGDGILNSDDQSAIDDYFLGAHNVIPEPVLSIKDYPFYLIPNQTELDSGDLLVLQIAIGNQTFPVLDLHGLAFGLQISPEIIDSSSFDGEFYTDSWFTYANPSLQMIKQPAIGDIHSAFTRSGGGGVSGHGPIGQISFLVVDEFDGFKGGGNSKTKISRIFATGIIMEDENGDRVQVPDAFVDITIRRDQQNPNPTEDKLIVYPNPASDYVYLHFNGRNTIYGYTMTDMVGRVIYDVKDHNLQAATVDTQNLPAGVYALRVTTSQGVISKMVKVAK